MNGSKFPNVHVLVHYLTGPTTSSRILIHANMDVETLLWLVQKNDYIKILLYYFNYIIIFFPVLKREIIGLEILFFNAGALLKEFIKELLSRVTCNYVCERQKNRFLQRINEEKTNESYTDYYIMKLLFPM